MTDFITDGGGAIRRRLGRRDYIRINLGKDYWQRGIKDIQDAAAVRVLDKYCRNIVDMVNNGYGLMIGGDVGRGKTTAAAVVLKEATRRGLRTYFISYGEIRQLQFEDRVFGSGGDGITVRDRVRDAQLLVLDGFDSQFFANKAFGPVHLEELVASRRSRCRATILTTRVFSLFGSAEMAPLFDVLTGAMVPLILKGENLRDRGRDGMREAVFGAPGGEDVE